MKNFVKKPLTSTKRVCFRLKEARMACGLSLAELAQKIKMSKKHLTALEACEFKDLPYGDVYRKNMVKAYCKAVNICPEDCARQYVNEEAGGPPSPQPSARPIRLGSHLPLLLRAIAILLLLVGIGGYLGLQIKNILEPPALAIYTPEDGFITDTNTVTVQGKTETEAEITINGTTIRHNDHGNFKETIAISDGVNTITIIAKKKHGKTTSATRHIIVRKTEKLSRH